MWKLPEQDLEALIEVFERSTWRELRLRMEGVELVLGKDTGAVYREIDPVTRDNGADLTAKPQAVPIVEGNDSHGGDAQSKVIPAGWKQVRAPSLGTFYRAPKPSMPPFVEVGSQITADTEVCLIEVMKLFTTVRAGIEGIIREVYPTDAAMVEFDQPLFLVEPHG
jgi:acetyl-CoA carboxylase biotin carboxyl carrier protein